MLFENEQVFKGIEAFDPSKCEMDRDNQEIFEKDDVAMGCSEGCWSGCIGGPHR